MRVEQKSLTLIELLLVVLILGIIVGFFLPTYHRTTERARTQTAQNMLSVIYNAQKRYKLDNQEYYLCNPCERDKVYEALGITLNASFFEYTIDGDAQGYTAIARRTEGVCKDATMQITQASSDIVRQGCKLW